MVPRLNHRKSRRGCTRCKERKTKCSEDKPTCMACQRHGVPCVYETVVPPRRSRIDKHSDTREAESTTPTSNSSITLNDPYPEGLLDISDQHRKQIELFLLHCFTSAVVFTFPATETTSLRHIYTQDAVDLSFEFPFLQNIIFAISALYTSLQRSDLIRGTPRVNIPPSLHPTDFGQVHRIYLNMAIQQQRAALMEITPANADALGITSIILSMIARRLIPTPASGVTMIAPYTPPVQSLYMSEATRSILQAAAPHFLPSSPMAKIMQQGRVDFLEMLADAHADEVGPFTNLLECDDSQSPEERTPEDMKAYSKALAFVVSIHAAILQDEPRHTTCRRIMAFAAVVPRSFMQLLVEMRPRALVVLAHYMALTKRVDQYWWLQGTAEREVEGISSVLPESWQWAMKWPREQILLLGQEKPSTSSTTSLAIQA